MTSPLFPSPAPSLEASPTKLSAIDSQRAKGWKQRLERPNLEVVERARGEDAEDDADADFSRRFSALFAPSGQAVHRDDEG
jgi:hypothetical protein